MLAMALQSWNLWMSIGSSSFPHGAHQSESSPPKCIMPPPPPPPLLFSPFCLSIFPHSHEVHWMSKTLALALLLWHLYKKFLEQLLSSKAHHSLLPSS